MEMVAGVKGERNRRAAKPRNRRAAENAEFAGDMEDGRPETGDRSQKPKPTAQVERSEIPRLKEFGIPGAQSIREPESQKS